MTYVALIPPYSLLGYCKGRPLQMLLPSCLSNPDYQKAFKPNSPLHTGGYFILDNGMFEKDRPISQKGLLGIAQGYKANEVILPDVRGDAFETYKAIKNFLDNYNPGIPDIIETNDGDQYFKEPLRFMAVIQGKTTNERLELVHALHGFLPPGTVLGFPRRLSEDGGVASRIDTMEAIVQTFGRQYKFHMLGLSRTWPGEFLRAKRQYGNLLRGLDTDAPFVWAYKDAFIEEDGPSFERPDNYFQFSKQYFDRHIVRHNIRVLECWAEGMSAPAPEMWIV